MSGLPNSVKKLLAEAESLDRGELLDSDESEEISEEAREEIAEEVANEESVKEQAIEDVPEMTAIDPVEPPDIEEVSVDQSTQPELESSEMPEAESVEESDKQPEPITDPVSENQPSFSDTQLDTPGSPQFDEADQQESTEQPDIEANEADIQPIDEPAAPTETTDYYPEPDVSSPNNTLFDTEPDMYSASQPEMTEQEPVVVKQPQNQQMIDPEYVDPAQNEDGGQSSETDWMESVERAIAPAFDELKEHYSDAIKTTMSRNALEISLMYTDD